MVSVSVSEATPTRGALLLETGVVSVVVCGSGAGSEAYTERLDASSSSFAIAVAVELLAVTGWLVPSPKAGW